MRIIGSAVSRWASPSCGAFPLPFPVYLPSVSPRQTTVLCGLIEVFDDLVRILAGLTLTERTRYYIRSAYKVWEPLPRDPPDRAAHG